MQVWDCCLFREVGSLVGLFGGWDVGPAGGGEVLCVRNTLYRSHPRCWDMM